MRSIGRYMKGLATASGIVALATAVGGVGLSGASAHSFKGTIKVGAFTDVTGALAVASGMQGGLAYFDAVNARGGVDGYKIVPTEYDTQSAPSGAVQAIRRAIAAKPNMVLGAQLRGRIGPSDPCQQRHPFRRRRIRPRLDGPQTLFPVGGDQVRHYSDVMLVVDKVYGHATKIALLGGTVGLPDAYNLIQQASRAGVQLVMQDLRCRWFRHPHSS